MLRDFLNSSSLERKFLQDRDEVWNFKVGGGGLGGGLGGGRGGGANSLPTSLKPLGKLVMTKFKREIEVEWFVVSTGLRKDPSRSCHQVVEVRWNLFLLNTL